MRLLILSLLCLLPLQGQTANPEENMRFLSVTSFHEPADSKNYAYLTWQAQSSDALFAQNHAIYRKTGPASSGNPFAHSGTMSFQTQLNIISALLDSTPPSLFNAASLEPMIDDLFGDLVASPSLTLAGKISGVMQAAKRDPAVFRRLVFLSRTQPVLGLCMGTAAVVPVSTVVTTFELRTLPSGDLSLNAQPGVVAGRVTLDLATPPSIPAPGPPVHVPDVTASGHLNAKLRWGVPANLRRRTPLTYGYNIYRMNRAFAVGAGYDVTPPTATVMTGLLTSDPNEVHLVNLLPLMPTKMMTIAEAANLAPVTAGGDPETYFTVDDNGVLLDGGVPLNDGDQFYYFAAARDLLGRPGAISPGTLVTICDRHRPLAPSRVKAVHKHVKTATPKDFLEVCWEEPTSGDTPDAYFVYRWANPEEMLKANTPGEYLPHQIAGPIPHDPATTRYRIRDNGAGAPNVATSLGQTWWYSVRAVKNTACGLLRGPNSAPGWGVLRDWKGPNAAGASLTVSRFCPTFSLESDSVQQLTEQIAAQFTGPVNGTYYYHLKLLRVDPRIKAAKIYLCADVAGKNGSETVTSLLGQKIYGPGDNLLDIKYRFPSSVFLLENVGLILCAVDVNGKEAYKKIGFNEFQNPDPPGNYAQICFCVEVEEVTRVISGGGVGSGDNTHTTIDPGTGGINPVEVTFTPSAGTKEYKLYKRIDGGPLLLVEQAEYDGSPSVTIEDSELPANSTEVCYFIQYFDEHGNPSPMADLGCLLTTTKVEMPVPIVAEMEKAGTQAAPQGVLKWFCQPEGVERFRIYICDGYTGVNTSYSLQLQKPLVAIVPFSGGAPTFGFPTAGRPTTSGGASAQGFIPFETGRIGGNFNDTGTSGEFTLTLDLSAGREYKVYIESVSAAGDRSVASNTVSFTWSQTNVVGPQVPWPARSLPALDPDFIPEIEADYAYNSEDGRYYAAVQIGELSIEADQPSVTMGRITADGQLYAFPSTWPDNDDYNLILYESAGGETALNFALYRYQVPNVYFPTVSGDLVQVSPLIDRVRTAPYMVTEVGLYDPFVNLLVDPDKTPIYGLYVKDTQGAIRGAKYVYVLVRFKENGEIDRCIPTNELEIPLVDPS